MENYDDSENASGKFQERAPIIETQLSKSKDGKWLIHKTVITDIKSVNYFERVLHPE